VTSNDVGSTVRLRIDFAYDGAPYAGFARQPDQITVQGVLEDALHRLFQGAPAETTCAGRTDRGVHAEAQTVHVDAPAGWRRLADLPRVRRDLDGMLGPTIAVKRVVRVPATFDARHSATQRRYRFRLWEHPVMPPLLSHDTWHVGERLDVEAMERAGQALVGTHDFDSFCRKRVLRLKDGRTVEAPLTRRVDHVTVRRSRPSGLVLLRIAANAFCHQQVRAITGSLVEVGKGRRPEEWFAELLAARDRTDAGPVAPPQGLSLVGVRYGPPRPA